MATPCGGGKRGGRREGKASITALKIYPPKANSGSKPLRKARKRGGSIVKRIKTLEDRQSQLVLKTKNLREWKKGDQILNLTSTPHDEVPAQGEEGIWRGRGEETKNLLQPYFLERFRQTKIP